MPTNEELAHLAYAAYWETDEMGDLWSDQPAGERLDWVRAARAVCEALTPPVEPLAPGETVTIRDGMCDRDTLRLDCGVDMEGGRPKYIFLTPEIDGDTDDVDRGQIALAAAGVKALRLACDRWLAAQEDQ